MIPNTVLPDFQDFLLSQKLAPEKNVPYLANWVSKFLAFNNRKGRTTTEKIGTLVLKMFSISAASPLSRLPL
jgi:hypothetical protein